MALVDSGKRFEVKSKAEETEYDRLWGPVGRLLFAALEADMGSRLSRDSLREDPPETEDDMDVRPDIGEEEAKDASSRESLGGFAGGV